MQTKDGCAASAPNPAYGPGSNSICWASDVVVTVGNWGPSLVLSVGSAGYWPFSQRLWAVARANTMPSGAGQCQTTFKTRSAMPFTSSPNGQEARTGQAVKGLWFSRCYEIVEDSGGGTSRAVYTVKFDDTVYGLHCFQKKSTHGIATPKPDMNLIQERSKAAEAHVKGKTK